ncbi:MAG: Ribonuclease BN-like family protein [Syntrophorhabdus sp. PtaU1.Bin153]|nr:MAG: Ribonuclease BN-like family protein [Syntrophorhabdus sp. PtaU1.Bin153]
MTRKRKARSVFGVAKALFTKYQSDHGNILVSSISFYVLLTFVPFTLLSIFILGNLIDLSNPGLHLEKYLKNIVPDPYNTTIVKKILKELNLISLSKKLSGPLGLLFLFFFTVRLFGIIRSAFQIIFSKVSKGFIRGKGEELFLTLVFSLVQTILFFSFVFRLVVQTKIISLLPAFFGKTPVIFIFSLLDMAVVFVMFFLLYWFLTPTPTRNRRVVLICTAFATFSWYAGKYFFEYFIIHIGKVTAFFGTYGVLIAFLFWVYFSVFTFVVGAELLSIIRPPSSRAPQPNYIPFRRSPSRARRD